jgi:hypothetical protein
MILKVHVDNDAREIVGFLPNISVERLGDDIAYEILSNYFMRILFIVRRIVRHFPLLSIPHSGPAARCRTGSSPRSAEIALEWLPPAPLFARTSHSP